MFKCGSSLSTLVIVPHIYAETEGLCIQLQNALELKKYIFGVIILEIAAPRGQYSHLFSSVWFCREMWKTAVNYGLNLCYFVCFYIIPWCGCKICTIFPLRMVSLVSDIRKPVSKILEGVAHALLLFSPDVSMKYLIVQVTC